MNYEIPNNMSINLFDTCELLWEYDGSNYPNSPVSGCTIPLDTSCFSLLVICVHDVNRSDKNSFLIVNDPTSPHDHSINVFKSYGNTDERRVTITENGLIFSPLYQYDSIDEEDDGTLCIPYQIYGIR